MEALRGGRNLMSHFWIVFTLNIYFELVRLRILSIQKTQSCK